MWGFLVTLFQYPSGIVLGNLMASAIWATPALIHLHRKIDRNHREHMEAIRRVPLHVGNHPTDGGSGRTDSGSRTDDSPSDTVDATREQA